MTEKRWFLLTSLVVSLEVYFLYIGGIHVYFAGDAWDTIYTATTTYWQYGGVPGQQFFRPVASFTFDCLYKAFGLNPEPYHVFFLFLHTLNCLCVYLIARSLLSSGLIGFSSAFLFASLPIHSQPAFSVPHMVDPIWVFFALTTLFTFIRYMDTGLASYKVLSLTCMALALLSKENAIVILPVIVLFYIYYSIIEIEPGHNNPGVKREGLSSGLWPYFAVEGLYLFYIVFFTTSLESARELRSWATQSYYIISFALFPFYYLSLKLPLILFLSFFLLYGIVAANIFWVRQHRWQIILLGLCILSSIVPILYGKHFQPRYFYFSSVFTAILLSTAVINLTYLVQRFHTMLVYPVIFIICTVTYIYLHHDYRIIKEDERTKWEAGLLGKRMTKYLAERLIQDASINRVFLVNFPGFDLTRRVQVWTGLSNDIHDALKLYDSRLDRPLELVLVNVDFGGGWYNVPTYVDVPIVDPRDYGELLLSRPHRTRIMVFDSLRMDLVDTTGKNYAETGKQLQVVPNLLTGDFDGDGREDLCRIYPLDGAVYIAYPAKTSAKGYLEFENYCTIGEETSLHFSGDFDGDKKDEIGFVYSSAGKIKILSPLDKNGSTLGTEAIQGIHRDDGLLTGDFNGDGKKDFLILCKGKSFVYLSTGSSFEYAPGFCKTGLDRYKGLIPGDFDGDGKTDIAASDGKYLYILFSEGSRFVSLFHLAYNFEPQTTSSTLGANPGAAVLPAKNPDVGAYYNMPLLMGGGSSWAAGDFNGDGKEDIVHLVPDGVEAFLSRGQNFSFIKNFYTEKFGVIPGRITAFKANYDKYCDLILEPLLENSVRLEFLPQEVRFPKYLSDKIHYVSSTQLLTFKGVMSEKERVELLELSEDPKYREAVEAFFRNSLVYCNLLFSKKDAFGGKAGLRIYW